MGKNARRPILSDFDSLWREICQRSASFPVVQEYSELKHVFDMIKGCKSYLEIGTAEGNSLYALAHALEPGAKITYVDWDEPHTRAPRKWVIDTLTNLGYDITPIHANSNDLTTKDNLPFKAPYRHYDCVMIDAGHDEINVAIDAIQYAPLAGKYIFFHDVMLPEVARVFEWYSRQRPDCRSYRFINSQNFGYGVMECQ